MTKVNNKKVPTKRKYLSENELEIPDHAPEDMAVDIHFVSPEDEDEEMQHTTKSNVSLPDPYPKSNISNTREKTADR